MSACVVSCSRGQVRYWRCARTASELRRDMHYQLAPSLRPWTLLAYWTMNEGLGQYVVLLFAHFAFMLVHAPGGVIRCALHAWLMVAALLLDACVIIVVDLLGRYVADVTEQHTRCFAHGTSWAVSDAPPTTLAAPDAADTSVRVHDDCHRIRALVAGCGA